MAFKLAEAYVEFSQRGMSGVQAAASSLRGGFASATAMAGGLAASLGLIGVGAAATGMVKLAADAETAQVKFGVLLKSGDAAKRMIAEIDQFAAKTPFEKMEIADSAQKLLAFGSSADQVMGQLQAIGDIAALTGSPIGELSELYGKAQVAGTLFAEDINQLTGRGIPIIQEFAKQFGVTEGEVKKLASEGKITSANLAQAFESMTGAGGDFSGGMEALSQTTAGKFGSMVDGMKTAATKLGATLLPIANAGIDAITSLLDGFNSTVGPWLEDIAESISFTVRNFSDIWAISVEDSKIHFANMIEQVQTFGINAIEIAGWLFTNWRTIFTDMLDFTGTILSNIGTNLTDFLAAVQSWLAGDGFNFQFTGLTNGSKPFETEAPTLTQPDLITSTPERDAALARIAERENPRDAAGVTAAAVTAASEAATAAVAGAERSQAKSSTGDAESLFGRTRSAILDTMTKPMTAVAGNTKDAVAQQKTTNAKLDELIAQGKKPPDPQFAILG